MYCIFSIITHFIVIVSHKDKKLSVVTGLENIITYSQKIIGQICKLSKIFKNIKVTDAKSVNQAKRAYERLTRQKRENRDNSSRCHNRLVRIESPFETNVIKQIVRGIYNL